MSLRLVFPALWLATLTAGVIPAAEHPAILKDYTDGDTVLVAWIELAELDIEKLARTAQLAGLPAVPESQVARLAAIKDALLQLEVSRIYWISDLSEISEGPVRLLVPCAKPQQVQIFLGALGELGLEFEAVDGAVLCGTQSGLAALKAKRGSALSQLWDAIEACDQDHGLAFATPEYVASSLMAALDGNTSTEQVSELAQAAEGLAGLRWLALTVKLGPAERLRLLLKTDTAESAAKLQAFISTALRKKMRGAEVPMAFELKNFYLYYDSNSLANTVKSVKAMLSLRGSMQVANNLKQVALALHNYAATYKHLPPQSLVDEEGNRLLSWRVLILPYLEQQELYDQFHLDEPWDSPHNIELAKNIPEVYAALDSRGERLQKDGKMLTRIVAPLTKDSSFGRPGGPLWFSDFTDGTSNTLWFVETTDEQAVVWTKPEDLVVDTERPMVSIAGTNAKGFLGSLVDGAVRFISAETSDKVINGLLTIDGGERFEVDDLK